MRLLLASIAMAGLASPALATEWVSCVDPNGAASFDFLAGGADVLSVASITISVGDKVWASDVANGPGEPIEVGQSFEGNGQILIDATSGGALVAQLRLFVAEGGEFPVYGGVLSIREHGAWSVSCSGP